MSPAISVPIRILTPIWTGGATGRSLEYKASGVLGGMRQAFEMLVRKHGGHTCDITGGRPEHRCNYERDPKVCPACAVFGCTGLSRAFRADLAPGLSTYCAYPPDKDLRIHNRPHYSVNDLQALPQDEKERFVSLGNHVEYVVPCMIVNWLAGCVGIKVGDHFPKPSETDDARKQLEKLVTVHFSSEDVSLSVRPMRRMLFGMTEADLFDLIRYTLAFMSRYSGLGAKVRQGWGLFELAGDPESAMTCQAGGEAVRALVERCGFHHEWDATFPSASDCFSQEWELSNDSLGFEWPTPPRHPIENCRQIGFAMNYRLRRHIKFYENDNPPSKLPINNSWRQLVHGASKWDDAPWKKSIAFVRALFGRDSADDDSKHSGLIGTSHLFRRSPEDPWRIRLFGQVPEHYNYPGQRAPLSWNPVEVRKFLIDRMDGLLKTEHAIIKTHDLFTDGGWL